MQKVGSLFCIVVIFYGFTYPQQQYGNLRGVVLDIYSIPLPGVAITLISEEYGSRSVVTSENGFFRFINITPGIYSLRCKIPGFKTYIQENLDIRIGTNFDLGIVLETATLQEEVTIVAESPVVDTKKTGSAMNVTLIQLQEIPSARDPWVILQQVPGVWVTQENVGGSTSGDQSGFSSKGAWGEANMYNMDGIAITDMAATGTSSRYFDFDSFEEIQLITSGADAAIQSSGVSLNIITRRGGNKYEAMGRFFFTNDSLQGDNRTEELKDLDYVGDRINQIADYGLQLGGPIIRDKFWFWVGYGAQDIRRLTIDGYPHETLIRGVNAKLNFHISSRNRAELAFLWNLKTQKNREAGPTRPPETTLDQSGNGAPFLKFEDEHTFSDNFLLSLKIGGKFFGDYLEAIPNGGFDTQAGLDLGTGLASGTGPYYKSSRPGYNGRVDGNYFLEDVLGGDHEFKFGVEHRLFPTTEDYSWPQDAFKYYFNGEPAYAEVMRDEIIDYQGTRWSFHLNDAFTRRRLTLNLGLRFDCEKSIINESSVSASQSAPDLMPALTFPRIDPDVPLTTWAPRIGMTYALTADRKTILRANLARYAFQASSGLANHVNPAALAYAGYLWRDFNGDDLVTTEELIGYPDNILWYGNFDPSNPTAANSPNEIDKNLKSKLTDEFILGVEREIFSEFSLAVNFTYRRNHRLHWLLFFDKDTDWIETQSDWLGPIQGSLIYDGITYNYEYWTLNRYRPAGSMRTNRSDYQMRYAGLEFVATKRLSNRWMLNASFTFQRQIEDYGEIGYTDPTNIDKLDGRPPRLDPRWMVKLSFLYQLPWGFNFSCFANAREGTIQQKAIRLRTPERAVMGLGSWTNLDTEKWGTTRLQNFYNVDLSLVKDFLLGRYGRLSLELNTFNVFNYNWDLQRFWQVNSPRAGEIEKILNPRVIRFGLRYRY